MDVKTPRRSQRIIHTYTPKMSERKKGLFQSATEPPSHRDSLTKHRQLKVLDSESESDDCDLGIMGTLDSSSCDENDSNFLKTPEQTSPWRTTRSHTKMVIKEKKDLKNFLKSPFTLKKYQTRYSCPDAKCSGSLSTPATPHPHNHPTTPSSTHSCASAHTVSSTSSRARKSLASLIADTESCSSSLKDLNFDSDSAADSKENTPSKSVRRSSRRNKVTPKLSFTGILMEQKKNLSPTKNPTLCLTKMDMTNLMSPTQMLKTPHNDLSCERNSSPPKLGHNRRSVIQIDESPESTCDSERSHKRLHFDSKSDNGPNSKCPKLETAAPKARLSLFNSDRLKEILSTKSFYGKSNPDINKNMEKKISQAIEATQSHRRRLFSSSHSSRHKRRPGQINLGVRHRIRKPKLHKGRSVSVKSNSSADDSMNVSKVNSTASSGFNSTLMSHNTSQDLENEKADPFDKEKQTIEALLSQWNEEEVPESELNLTKNPELPCFHNSVIEETRQIFQPVQAVPVPVPNESISRDSETVIVELGGVPRSTAMVTSERNSTISSATNVTPLATNVPTSVNTSLMSPNVMVTIPNASQQLIEDIDMTEVNHRSNHGDLPNGQFLPVEGGYILVDEGTVPAQEELPDLDEIERELKMLDEQILRMAHSNNINAEAVLASTETAVPPSAGDVTSTPKQNKETKENGDNKKVFPIFSKPNPGMPITPKSTPKGTEKQKRPLLKSGTDQYVIDAGQKKFGATQCAECGVIYQIGDPQDEHDHMVHHNSTDVLKFNGLKDEYIVGKSGSARCIRVRGGASGWKKVEAVLARVIHPQLGYGASLPKDRLYQYTAYLYIDKKQIIGCMIVEPKVRAYKLIPGDPDCCSVEDYPVKCGVSRIWTHKNYRRRGLASRMLDCARASFLYGDPLRVQDLAFSAPTAAGKAFATKYCGGFPGTGFLFRRQIRGYMVAH